MIKQKSFEELELQDDFMFGAVMSKAELCRPFLERVLDVRIHHIDYIKKQETMEADSGTKGIRLDIYVEDNERTVYNVEMQTSRRSYSPKRIRYYQDLIDINQIMKGEDYCKLKKNIVIFVCTFDPFGINLPKYTFCNTCQEKNSLLLEDETEKIILNTKGIKGIINKELENLLRYIETGVPVDDYTALLDSEVRLIRSNEKWRMRYMTLSLKYAELQAEARAEGLAEGRAEGREEGRAEGETRGKVEGIMILLEELGEIPEYLEHRISSEQNPDKLKAFLKCAAKADSIEDFTAAINEI